jgi:hypothetical protein
MAHNRCFKLIDPRNGQQIFSDFLTRNAAAIAARASTKQLIVVPQWSNPDRLTESGRIVIRMFDTFTGTTFYFVNPSLDNTEELTSGFLERIADQLWIQTPDAEMASVIKVTEGHMNLARMEDWLLRQGASESFAAHPLDLQR